MDVNQQFYDACEKGNLKEAQQIINSKDIKSWISIMTTQGGHLSQ